jgi:hypothetical protein
MTVQKTQARTVELGSGWPGWVPRVVLLLAGVGAATTLLGNGVTGIALVFIFVFALLVPLVPATPSAAILIGAVAIAVAAGPGPALRPEVLIEIPLLHLVHVVAALSALVPLNAVIQPAALWPPVRRFLVVQAVTFAVAGVSAALPTGRNTTVVELAGLIASIGLVMLAIRVVVRRR